MLVFEDFDISQSLGPESRAFPEWWFPTPIVHPGYLELDRSGQQSVRPNASPQNG
jgi:hypothetical protein